MTARLSPEAEAAIKAAHADMTADGFTTDGLIFRVLRTLALAVQEAERARCAALIRHSNFVDGPQGTIEGQIERLILTGDPAPWAEVNLPAAARRAEERPR